MNEKDFVKMKKVKTLTLILLVFSLFLLLSGVTFAVFSKFLRGSTTNVIQAGVLSFTYDEDEFQGNGVKIEDAFFTSDSVGKLMSGTHEYFDFSVNARATLSDISYQVIIVKQPQSTLDEKLVKIYLTTKNGNLEVASPLVESNNRVLTYKELSFSEDGDGKIAYTGFVPQSENSYHQEFRLRMWISDDLLGTETIDNQEFSVKVKVVATEVH